MRLVIVRARLERLPRIQEMLPASAGSNVIHPSGPHERGGLRPGVSHQRALRNRGKASEQESGSTRHPPESDTGLFAASVIFHLSFEFDNLI